MNKTKRFLGLFLIVFMLLAFVPLQALANTTDEIAPADSVVETTDAGEKSTGNVAKVGNTEYATLANAFANANGNTVTLLNDIKVTEVLTVVEGTSATLDLNGYDAVLEGEAYIFVKSNGPSSVGMLTVKDTSENADGRIVGVICVNGTLNLESGTITSAGYGVSGIPATVVLQPDSYANYPELNVTGGTIEFTGDLDELGDLASFATAIFASGTNGRGSDMNFSEDATVKSTGSCVLQNVKISDHGDVTVTNGTFKCGEGFEIFNIDTTGGAEVAVSGGTFSSAIPEKYCADGFELVENADGTYGVEKAVSYVAEINGTGYATIDEAIAAWTNNATLTLLADVTLSDVVTLKSTEHHILNLGTYTMTAASGKNAFVIQACGNGSAERTAITINADAKNPGGINAGSKCVVYYKYADGGISTEDRPIIKINGGVFNGTTSTWGTAGIYTIGTAARKCATVDIAGGTFNCSINGSGKSKLIISGGTFNYSVGSQGDSTALRLISGGTFKTFGFMTADSNNTKFWFGTSMANSNVGVYVDDNGYIVVGGTVITEAGEKFEASSANYSGANSLLQYSSAKTNGLYYTSVEEAFADNNKASGEVTVYVDELDMSGISYKGTIVVPKDGRLKITNAPAGLKVENEAGDKLELDAEGNVFKPVAKIGEVGYATLSDALAAAADGATIKLNWAKGDAPIAMNGAVYGKTVTITGTATVDWGEGFLFVGRGGEGDGEVIFDGANLTSASNQASTGIHVSGREKDTTNKYDGTLTIKNSTIELDYLINKGTITLDNSTLTVKNGFAVGGRPASETESGVDATATMTLDNGSKLVVNNHNGMGLGYEAIGVMTVNSGSTFETTQSFLVTAKGTLNVNGGSVNVAGTLTNNGTINVSGESTLNIETLSGSSIDLCEGAIVKNSTVGGAAYIAGNVTFRGKNTFDMLTDYGDYYSQVTPSKWTVESGASLTLTKYDRYGLGYGDKVTVFGNIEDALNARETLTDSDIAVNMYGGLVGMTNSAASNAQNSFTAENAYLIFGIEGDKSFGNKAGSYYGNYKFTFDNCVVTANAFKFYEDKGTSIVVLEDTDLLVNGVFMTNDASSEFKFTNCVIVSKAASNGSDDKNQNAGTMVLVGTDLTYNAAFTNIGTITLDLNSSITAPSILGSGKIVIDATGFTEAVTVINGDMSGFTGTIEVIKGEAVYTITDTGLEITKAVASVNGTYYASLQAAINAAVNGDVITLVADIEQEDGVIITDKNITIDLNDKTFTVTVGASTNNRNIKINGSSVVTIKNGTMVAKGDYSSGAYGTVRTEGTANVTLTDLKLYNYRGNGLNIKACTGTTVTISNTEIYSQYGGGIEAAGGTIELTNVTVEQKGMYTAPYNSMAVSVNGGGKVTVNSGTYTTECLTAEEANNQGTSHGSWCVGVLNSGGTLIINGGTFANGNFGDDSLATYARGLVMGDTGAVIEINGGTFNALKGVIDVQNNLGDASKNPTFKLAGGTYSADPTDNGWFGNLITLAAGYEVAENDDNTYSVVKSPVAQIGDVKYTSLADAFAAAQAGDTIVLLADVTVDGTAQIPAGVTIKSNGKTINGSIRMLGDLTLDGPLTITGGLWVGKSGETLTATLAGDKLTASYFMFQRGTYTIDADIDAVYGYLSFEGTFEVNSTIHTTGANGEVLYINGNVTLNDGAVLDSDNSVFLNNANAVLTIKPGAKVDSNLNITNAGAKLVIDATGAQAGEYAGITGTVTNSVNGTIEAKNGSFIVNIVGGKIVLTQAVAQIGGVKYATLSEALEAAKVMTGDVTIEIFDKATLNSAISGSFDSITFVGKDTDAEIYLDVQGYITATGKNVAFEDLKLSKSEGGYVTNAGFMNLAFGVYDVVSVNYTNCTFLNGACASSGEVTFTGCTFYRSHDRYGLWVYGAEETTVDGCTFADIRGIKFFSEGKLQIGDLIVKNTNFSAADNKPAIVLTSGKSVTLENNTYSSKGVFELDLDGVPNGTAVTSDVPPTCVNDNGACGVLVDGKIYTTVAQAAEVAVSGSNVTLLFNSAETVEFGIGVNLDKNGFKANGVTVAIPAAQIGDVKYATLSEALVALKDGETLVITDGFTAEANMFIELNGKKNITITAADGVVINGSLSIGYHASHIDQADRSESTFTVSGLTVNGTLTVCSNDAKVVIADNTVAQLTVKTYREGMNITIDGNTADGSIGTATNGYGMFIVPNATAYNLTLNDNTFVDVSSHAFVIQGCGDGKAVTAANSITVTENNFKSWGLGGKSNRAAIKIWADTKYAPASGSNVNQTTNALRELVVAIQAAGNNTFGSTAENTVEIDVYDIAADLSEIPAPFYAAAINGVKYDTLQAAIDAVENGETIVLLDDVTEELVTIEKASGVAFTIDGKNNNFTGEFEIGIGESITIKNVNFVATSEISPEYFIDSMDKNSNCILTIISCSFKDTDYSTTAIGTHQPTKVVIGDCIATGVASLLQNQGGYNITVTNTVIEGKRGISLGTVVGATVENVKITAANDKYGIRLNGEIANNTITIKDCEISAFIPVVVRKAQVENYNVIFKGTNTMTPANTDGLWMAIGTSEYDTNGTMPTAPTGKVVVALNDTGLDAKGIYGNYGVASINGVKYLTLAEAIAAAKAKDTVVLLADVTVAEGETIAINGFNLDAGSFKLTNNGIIKVSGESTLKLASFEGESIDLLDGAIVKNSIINGHVFVAGKVIFRGDNTVGMIYDYGTLTDYYGTTANMEWSVEEGASLTITDKARYGLGYGDKVTIYGSISDALEARENLTDGDVAFFTHGLVAQESKGWNCDSYFTVENAYVVIGSNNSFGNKPGNYGGEYTFYFVNSVVDASRITFYEALSKTEFTFENSDVKVGTFMTNDADSVFTLINTKLLSTTLTNGNDEGNYNAGTLILKGSSLTYSAQLKNNGTIELDINSSLTAPSIIGNGKIVIDVTGLGFEPVTVIGADMSGFTGTVEIKGGNAKITMDKNGLVVTKTLSGEGTATNPYEISTAEDLFFFAKRVNDGTYVNVYVVLTADIDLEQEDWTSIGTSAHPFTGTFDGQKHTISNLWCADDQNGLFGYTSTGNRGDNTGYHTTIKNFTIDGAVVADYAQKHAGAAAVVGCGNMHTTIDSVNVTGEIIVIGARAGAIMGYAYNGAVINNCHVDGINNAESSIKALYWAVGGIGGFLGTSDSSATVTNCSVKNVTIIAENHYGAAAIVGNTNENDIISNVVAENVIVKGAYGEDYNALISSGTITGNSYAVNSTLIVGGVVVEAPYDVVAKVGNTYYISLEAAFAAANEGDTIVLLADATPALKSQRAITKASVIDLNGNTLTLTEDDLYFGTTTFQNGTIVVDPSVKPSTAVFWMFADQTLTFDGVKLVATGVSGTYLIGLDGNNSDLNLVNGSEIVVNNETALDLDIICVNASTGNDIVIDNSKINVTNLDGRVLFRGNYTISGASEITLSGITKAGIRIEAGQTLSIEDTSVVTITGDLRDGGIHLTDATATYTKADTATVNATVNKPVATIGSKSYFSLEDAFKAAQNGDEVKILVAGEYKLTVSGKDITITGAVDGVEFVGITAYSIKSSVTFNNITFTYDMASGYKGLQDAGDMVYNNCTFNGQVFLYGTSETFNNCTFIQTDENNYNVWTYAAKEVAFNGCTFNAAGRSVLVYNEGSTYAVDVTFTDTTFVSSKAVDGKAAIEIDTSYCAGANVTVNNTTATGFGAGNVSGNSLWNNKKGNYTDANNDITVVVDGETVLAPVTFVAQVGDKKFASLQEAFQAATNGAVIEILNDVTIDDKWDCRSTGAKFTVPVTIDGNGKTIKFTGAIIDNNWNTVFRFEEVATVKDLTIDVSEATGVQRIISAKLGGTFDNCTFIGKGDGYGIIFGEGAGTALSNVTVTITNSTFKNFGRGVSDNRNDQDAKAIVVDNCEFENSKVLLGASESVTFTNNTVVNGQVDIKSYSNIANVVVEATGNTLEAGKNFITANPANVTAQGGFALPVATANGNYYFSLQEAIISAAPNGTVELLSDVVVDKWTMITEKPIGSNQLITLVIDDLTIDGNGHTLTVKSIESAGNGDHLFDDARNLTVKDLTIVNESGKNGGIGLYSGSIENVTFVGGIGVFPQASANTITITGCTFDTTGDAIYYESARDNLVVTGNTFDVDGYAIILRGKEVFANNTIVSGKVNVASSASSTVTGNSFGDNRFKVYNGATATIAENTINNLVFNDGTITKSVFTNNTFSEAAQAAYDEVKGLSGSGTEADPYKIGSVEELNIFAKRVNDGSYTTEYFVLTADIDMNGATWERGIGDGINATFDGKFNGQGFAIKNLNLAPKADSDGYLCGGLFGYTYGAVTIKNLVLENITVKAEGEGHNVGALVGFANNKGGKLNVSNVTVKNVTIDAPDAYGVGAIVGYSYRDMGTIENCVVDGANITGYSFVGGITGYSYSNAVITGCSVNNATIKATSKGAGGIAGLALGGSEISNNTVANTVVTAPTNWGYVIGEVASEGIVVSSNNASEPQVGGAYSTGKPVQAKVGNKYYTTLEAAIEAANGETVVLLNTVVIGKGEEAVIDLKGATVVYETSVANVAMIRNNGTLTIKDSVGDGKLSIKYTGASFGYGVGVYTIVNQGGTLNIEGGTIENLTNVSGSMYDAIDNNSTLGDTVLNISGGVVSCPAYIGIRQFANNTTAKNIVNITGGTVTGGNTSVWVQNPNSYNNNAELNISNGTINGRLLADDSSAFAFAVNGGTFSVPVADKFCQEGYHSHAKANGTFAVEEINLKYTAGVDATCTTAGVKPGTYCEDCMVIITLPEPIAVKGHSYNAEVTDPTCTAKGYTTHTCTVCGDTYVDSYVDMVAHTEEEIPAVAPTVDAAGSKAGVKCSVCGEIIVAPETIPALVAVAQIGNTKFETLAAAIAAANAGDTIEILGNIEANSVIMIDKSITINGNGYNVTSSANRVFRITTGDVEVTLNDVNMVSTAFSTYTSDVRGISIDSNLTGVNLTLNDCSVEFDPTSGSDWAYAVNVTGGSANILTINGGTYEGANVINVWGDDHEIVINGATLTSLYNAPQNGYYGQCVRLEGTGNEVVISNTTFNGDHAIAIGEATKDSNDVAQFNNVNNTKRYLAKIDSEYFYTLAEAFAAAESGDTIVLLGSITIDGDNTIVVKKSVTLDLNGCTISAVTDEISGNRNVFDVRGTLTVMGGTITLEHVGTNMGWGSSTNVFNVTAGGILNIANATVKNLGGSDMAFVAHLNNWGEVTLNVKDSTLESTYVAVRVFNSGYDKNNVTIENSTLSGDSAAFWVHNYTVADFGSQEKADAQEALLNFSIFNGNTFVSGDKVGVIRYGFTKSARFDKDGNCVHNTTDTVLGKEATCTETGLTDGSKCAHCDATVVERETIPVIAHTAGEAVKENENAPTCTATGSYDLVVYCTECDAKLSSETVTVDKLAHNPGDVEIANKTDATCTEDGKYDLVVYCSACDTKLSTGTITIPATGHAFGEWIFDAENCTVVRTCANDAAHTETKSVVAKNGNEYYETLQDAVNAGGTVVLLKNIALDSSVTVSGTVALNLNGKTITGTDNNVKGNFYLFNVTKGASFTVGGEGEITLTATTERNWNASSVVIANNQGTVTVNGGTIKHLGGTSMAYALDNLTNGKNTIATMVVNGGTIDSTYFAIRQFANGGTNNLTINGGDIGYVWMQSPNANANVANTTVTGGSVDGICLSGANANATLKALATCVGEVYGTAPADYKFANVDGYYVVVPCEYVAQVGDNKYESFEEAIAAANANGGTVVLLENITLNSTIKVTGKVTLDLNGKTITGTDNSTGSFSLFTNNGEFTVTGDGAITLVANNNRGWNGYSTVISNTVGGKLVVNGGTIKHLGGTDMAYAIDNLTNGKGTYAETVINGGEIISTYSAIRQFLNGTEAQNILTINGGTVKGTKRAIYFQDPSKNANSGTLTIGENASINGTVYLDVTEGSTEWPVTVSVATAALKNGSTVTTENVPSGYHVTDKSGTVVVEACTPVIDAAKDATCTETGLTAGSHCSVCGEVLEAQTVVPATGHTAGTAVKENENAPTCTATGSYDNVTKCTVCGEELSRETVTVPVIDHSYNAEVTDPTCTAKGYTTYTCSVCGDTYVDNYVDMVPHTLKTIPAVNATCTATGLTEGKYCKVCMTITVVPTVTDKVAHTEVEIPPVAPTYENVGYEAGIKCSVCGTIIKAPVEIPALKAVAKVGNNYYATLEAAIAAAGVGDTVELLADVNTSSIITINKAITLNGNGKTITSTAGRAINVSGANGVTIKNVTIEASGERAINVIQGATNVVIYNVDATAANYTVNVASSAKGAIVTIENSTLTGLNVVNVSAANANVTVNGGKLVCNDKSGSEKYAALALDNGATDAVITATNVNFTIEDDSNNASNSSNGGKIIIDGVEADKAVAFIKYANGTGYSFETLAGAFAYAKDGDTILLLGDVTIDELIKIEKNVTLDLGGHTVTSTSKKAFEVYADATIENGTIVAANRCVDTREAVELTLDGVKLIANKYTTAYGNPQPLTIGGSENGTVVNMNNVSIDAGTTGYGIITFVKTELNANDSEISGYSALYVKPGSEGSSFTFTKSVLTGTTGDNDVEGNSFSVIAVRANGTIVNVDKDSAVIANGDYCYAITLGGAVSGEETTTGVSVTVVGAIYGNVITSSDVTNNTVKIPANVADKLSAEYSAIDAGDGLVELVKKTAEESIWKGISVTAGASLDMNFYVDMSKLDANKSYYAKAIKVHTEACGTDSVEIYIPQSAWIKEGSVMKIVVEAIAAKEMNCDIQVQIFEGTIDEDGIGTGEAISNVNEMSIRNYALYWLENSDDAKLKTTLIDMLNYGAAAQVYLKHDANEPANRNTDEYQSYATEGVDLSKAWFAQEGNEHAYDISLVLADKVELVFWFSYFDKIEGFNKDNLTAKITYTDFAGYKISYDVASEDISYNAETGIAKVKANTLSAADMNTVVTCELMYNGEVISTVHSNIAYWCFLAYYYEKPAEIALAEKIMKYGQSAYNYFSK